MKESACKVSDANRKAKRGGASTLSKSPASQQSRCITVGTHFTVIAANDGSVYVKENASGNCVKEFHDSDEWIEVMAFSPD